MAAPILVTYATRTGTTAGVAEEIGETLGKNVEEVEVLPMEAVADLSRYRAVVAGSAIQNQQWLPEAMQFIRTNQNELKQRPFAMFTVCMTLAMRDGEKYRPAVSEWLNPIRSLVRPVSEGLFAGALDIAAIPSISDRIKFRISVAMGVWSEGDHRDWDAIHDWANELHSKLV